MGSKRAAASAGAAQFTRLGRMIAATQLTRLGRLMEATRVIQRALGMGEAPYEDRVTPRSARVRGKGEVVDVPCREATRDAPGAEPLIGQPNARSASFGTHLFAHGGKRWRYRVYEPQRSDPAALLPLVVMLHGCKQDSEDFARGTGMNEVAAREGFLVLYPEQLRKSNSMGCWNWFESGHQGRGAGEPAMIAALVQRVLDAHGGDPHRVYVAGLSAGGAMATTVAELYPEVFAAVGVHSGLPPGAAHDIPSAFTAMRKGAAATSRQPAAVPVPTIVFHGTADRTVAPANGEQIAQRQLAARRAAGQALEPSVVQNAMGEHVRKVKCARWTAADGRPVLESWTVESGPHAWSGGSAAGSFTDPQGPSASEAMARFFLRQRSD
jgi:poly(hydroxyalkanoate) depolymerase family esterase